MLRSLVGSEMCIRDSSWGAHSVKDRTRHLANTDPTINTNADLELNPQALNPACVHPTAATSPILIRYGGICQTRKITYNNFAPAARHGTNKNVENVPLDDPTTAEAAT
eukprot:TRINITY_DN37455_c0_g1_i1.p2 TRINITY_DN37455_c0_g1~~TRINITY_DN37455_c0_g1_i1.p2  ORF type:complete len:109 (-),score=29.11 TRINITY_DN37455_c0_g1_i1:272-598(-)